MWHASVAVYPEFPSVAAIAPAVAAKNKMNII
jgi:hypothetical protein